MSLSRRRFLAATSLAAAGAALPLGCVQAQSTQRIPDAAPIDPRAPRGGTPRNVILMIPDGFGIASATMARMATGRKLALDSFVTGHCGTQSSDSFVTDSAAAGTALASGVRSYNGAIGMDDARRPVASLLEAARARSMKTGLVTTTRMTHATPAVFAAHVTSRAMEEEIALQMLATAPDVMLGGGIEFFLPTPEGRRRDGRDLLAEARAAGYEVITRGPELATARGERLLGLFSVNHLAYEVDRPNTDQPSLAEMTRKALALLHGTSEGFFVMVEGGRIDHAGHGNDAVGHLSDTLAYDAAVAEALAFAEADGETLVVSVADHECGGLSIGRDGRYAFRPEVLLEARASAEGLMADLARRTGGARANLAAVEATILANAPIEALEDEDRARLVTALQSTSQYEPGQSMAAVISRHAVAGWTTGGHTGEDVTIHAAGPGSDQFTGHLENFEVPRRIAAHLGLDLEAETARLRERMGEAVTTG
ncbi:MAG: alkaline phosphatase [Rubricoccaceae bacterium]